MLRNIELAGYDAPTPIQKCTIPAIHRGYDTIAIAQTGSFIAPTYPRTRTWLSRKRKRLVAVPNHRISLVQVPAKQPRI